MARYSNPELRDRLAAEYVLGTLRGRARSRFQALLRYDPDLRRIVAAWEGRRSPLSLAAAGITPPERVWRALERRIRGTRAAARWWESLGWWRAAAITSTAFVLALSVVIGMAPRHEPPMSMVSVMAD